ncbi:MAG: hypothetical protein ACW981_20485 [Candidatus Hodarchaeales archaeon]|jgi:hypothetical protein
MNEFPQTNFSADDIQKEEDLLTGEKFRNSLINSSIIIMYSAAAVGSSTILLFIPNLETISFFIFLVTLIFGFKIGIQMMLTTTIVFEFFATSLYGFGGWILIFKIIPYFIFVLVASLLKKSLQNENPVAKPFTVSQEDNNSFFISSKKNNLYSMIFFFILGFSLTIIYDVFTTLSLLLIVPSVQVLILNFIFGIPYTLFHEITNGLLFMLIPVASQLIKKSSVYSN